MTSVTATATRLGRSQPELGITSGDLALSNLQAQIEGLERLASEGGLGIPARSELTELIAQRGHILGRIADVERADDLVRELRREAPNDAAALVAQARSQARFHLFSDALVSLEDAERAGTDRAVLDAERAGILQAIGHYDEALALLQAEVERHADFFSLGALAVFHAEQGETSEAEDFFEQSGSCYRGVSPIPLAILDFQRGHMWMAQGDHDRARIWFAQACTRVPAYAPAQGHLAEVEAAQGEIETSVERLLPLTESSDDPDYAAALARILRVAGQADEATRWQAKAEARYEELISRRLEAFADHAAAFWLDQGSDPHRALSFAKLNLEIRQTPRARRLFSRASRACAEDRVMVSGDSRK